MLTPKPGMNKPGRLTFFSLLTSVALLSALFRLGALDVHQRPDENYVANNLLNFYRTASPAPSHFIHPPLYHYFSWAAMTPVLPAAGKAGAYEAYGGLYFSDRAAVLKVCRLVSWLFSAALPPLLFLLAWRLYGALPPALLAGVLLAVSFWPAAHSRDALPDGPMSFFFTAAAGLALVGAKEKKRGLVLAAAFLGGLAAAVKTNGAAILPAVYAAFWFIPEPPERRLGRRALAALLSLAAACAACAAGLYLTGAWESVLYFFSPDGSLEPDSLEFCRAAMSGIFYLSLGTLILAGLLLRRLRQVSCPAAEPPRPEDKALRYISGRGLYLATFLFAAGFLVFNPYWVIYFKKFFSTFVLTAIHVQSNGHFGMMGRDWVWYASSLWANDGLLALIAGTGLLLAWRSRGAAMAASVYFLLLFLYVGAWEEKADRFMQVFLPLGYLAAAGALCDFTKGRKWRSYGLAALVMIAVVAQAFRVRSAAIGEILPDSRASARAWMESSLPEGSPILLDSYFLPELRSEAQLENIRREFTARGMPSVEKAYRSSRLFRTRDLESLPFGAWRQWDWANFDYLVIVSDRYWHLFDDSQEPPPGHILREPYRQRREFYSMALRGEIAWLKPLSRFGGNGMSGPLIDIYKIDVPGRGGPAKTAKNYRVQRAAGI